MNLQTFIDKLQKLLPQYKDCEVVSLTNYGINLGPQEPEIEIYNDQQLQY
jgi:hypothetical protein